jgi:(1->4)-alpha-D-glucan 1-alpha-D-glucosylmutase
MAKGFEDTTLYCYNRLLSLNEVGGHPDSSGLSIDEYHRDNLARLEHWPHTLNATSTHDTKRSEDVRARINVLSEIPEEWEMRLNQWSDWNLSKKMKVKGLNIPEPNTEIFLYQTLIGAYPLYTEELTSFKERLKAYMLKAIREAKVYTSWLSPDSDYEAALTAFVDSILESSKKNYFLEDFLRFEKQIAYYGALNSLSQVLLKITSPGVPDFYQGTELWDFSLVDPDNRRPVDFGIRMKLLDDLIQQEAKRQYLLVKRILKSWQDGRIKLYVTYKALNTRIYCRDVFLDGQYLPLKVAGERQEHAIAFIRHQGGKWLLTVVPRLLTKLINVGAMPVGQEVWGDDLLMLPKEGPDYWLNIFTGEKLSVSSIRKGLPLHKILSIFPVALLKNM